MKDAIFNGMRTVKKFQPKQGEGWIKQIKALFGGAQSWADTMEQPVEVQIFGFRVFFLPKPQQPQAVSLEPRQSQPMSELRH